MSEDIDIILNWQLLGASINEPLQERSKRQQEIYNERLNNLAKEFIANELYYDLLNGLSNIDDLKIEVNKDKTRLNVFTLYYKRFNILIFNVFYTKIKGVILIKLWG